MCYRNALFAVLIVLAACGDDDTVKKIDKHPPSPLAIPHGVAPTVDGVVEPDEWAGAVSVSFSVDSLADVTVRMKHDSLSLYLLFIHENNKEDALIFPEVLIDAGGDKSADMEDDDYWFHVSGSDCEARGTYGVYDNCRINQPDWDAAPNYQLTQNPPPIDAIEISIPFDKPAISVGENFGLMLTVEYVPDRRASWPLGSALASPATWGSAALQ